VPLFGALERDFSRRQSLLFEGPAGFVTSCMSAASKPYLTLRWPASEQSVLLGGGLLFHNA